MRLLVGEPEALDDARARFDGVAGVEIVARPVRRHLAARHRPDLRRRTPRRAAAFRFNGWGGKYELRARRHGRRPDRPRPRASPLTRNDFILEGGAVDHDGRGTILTTRQCLLNPNRNPGWTEARPRRPWPPSLGAKKVLWLGDGLLNDHTDGHVDNLARFVAPGVVACPVAWGKGDPNAEVYDDRGPRPGRR